MVYLYGGIYVGCFQTKSVCKVPTNDLQSLKRKIVQACEEIQDAQCRSTIHSLIDKCNACLPKAIILNKRHLIIKS